MKKNRVFLRGPALSTPGRAVVPSKPWPCATCVTDKSAVTALSHPKRSPPPKEAASTPLMCPTPAQDASRTECRRGLSGAMGESTRKKRTFPRRGAQRQKRRGGEQEIAQGGCMAPVPLKPSAQDEEEPRISPWAYAEHAGQGRRAQQTLALRDLRYGQISGYSIEPSQA